MTKIECFDFIMLGGDHLFSASKLIEIWLVVLRSVSVAKGYSFYWMINNLFLSLLKSFVVI